ncbi:MAG: hypothetical protein O2780_12600 [Proteobacteria bacterium]|nr:hypothetical protein [Pseudomonadota bacterium]
MSENKYEFCSSQWVDYARQYLKQASDGADLSGIEIVFNEVFTDAPDHLALDDKGRTGWYLRVANSEVEVDRGILDQADVRIIADYDTILPLARMVFAGNTKLAAEAQQAIAAATESGKMHREGDATKMAGLPWTGELHDALARRTL